MIDPPDNGESFQATSAAGPHASDEAVPQFGAIDIVEAFTAMRHEWRGQTKESRELIEQVSAAVTRLESLEARLGAEAAEPDEDSPSKQLAQFLAETDHQLSRAAEAAMRSAAHQRRRQEADTKAAERYFAGMSRPARWFARPLLTFIMEQRSSGDPAVEYPAIEGLNLVLTRLRGAMKDQRIERIDCEGQPFDAHTMNAIGTIETEEFPAGTVAEQLSPAYRWRGRLLRFADVRVAK